MLPLTGLCVRGWYDGSVAHPGQWTGLQSLKLEPNGDCDIPQLAGQLVQLTALQELALIMQQQASQASQLQPLVDAIVGMASLRSVDCGRGVLVAQQRAQLQAATQLTKLTLR